MRVGVIADEIAGRELVADELRGALDVLADEEERRRRAVFRQHAEDLRRPDRMRPVVEGQRDSFGRDVAAKALQLERPRQPFIPRPIDETIRHREIAHAVATPLVDAQQLALALHAHRVDGRRARQRARSEVRRVRRAEERP